MQQTSTHDLLLLYAYDELEGKEKAKFEKQLFGNVELVRELEEIQQIQRGLSRRLSAPDPTSVRIVLEESLNSQLEAH